MSQLPAVLGPVKTLNIAQGEYFVTSDADLCLTTLLGSCVATCLWDTKRHIGGMNHYLLPGNQSTDQGLLRYGVNAMELLINGLLKEGCHKLDLQAKVFGGGQMLNASSQIGAENAQFARDYLRAEGIEIVGGSLGGKRGRRLRFFPTTGRVQQRLMAPNEMDLQTFAPSPHIPRAKGGELELF